MSEQRPEDVTPHVCDSPHLDLCTRPGHKEILTPTTPRVAESLDDLAVGMVVARHTVDDSDVSGGVITAITPGLGYAAKSNAGEFSYAFEVGVTFILTDPPAPPAPEEGPEASYNVCKCGHRESWHNTPYRPNCTGSFGECPCFVFEFDHAWPPAAVPAPHAEAEAAEPDAIDVAYKRGWLDSAVHHATCNECGKGPLRHEIPTAPAHLRGRGDRG